MVQAQAQGQTAAAPKKEVYYRQNNELIIDYDRVHLSDIIRIAAKEFSHISFDLLIFEVPDGFGNYYDVYNDPLVLSLACPGPCHFRDHPDSVEMTFHPRTSLADVIQQAACAPNPDFGRAKVGWLKGQMFLSVKK